MLCISVLQDLDLSSAFYHPILNLAICMVESVLSILQMSGWKGAQSLHANAGKAVIYTGMLDCFTQTVKEEGITALFKVH